MSETMSDAHADVESVYPPSAGFAAQANAGEELYREDESDRLAFWAKQANRLSWDTPFDEVLDWSAAPLAKWFVGGRLNVAYNCDDRHGEAGNGDQVPICWEGEPGDNRELTYADLFAEVSKAANALTGLGLVAGDR
jgi:acetyl-CoA synthetase